MEIGKNIFLVLMFCIICMLCSQQELMRVINDCEEFHELIGCERNGGVGPTGSCIGGYCWEGKQRKALTAVVS